MITRTIIAALALSLSTLAAQALPCLSKEQALKRSDAAAYRTVNGQRCWYVVDYVPDKAEFVQPKKRKEVVRHVPRPDVGPNPHKTTPAVARIPVQPPQAPVLAVVDDEPSAEWYLADRAQAIEALCGNPCRVGSTSPTARVADAFDGLMALIVFDRRSATSWRAALVGP